MVHDIQHCNIFFSRKMPVRAVRYYYFLIQLVCLAGCSGVLHELEHDSQQTQACPCSLLCTPYSVSQQDILVAVSHSQAVSDTSSSSCSPSSILMVGCRMDHLSPCCSLRSSVSRSSSSSGRFVVSKMSLIQIFAGLPLGRLPSIQPCIMVFSKQSPGGRMICPKYRNLRSVTDFSSWQSTPSSCNTLSFVLLAVHGTRNRRRYVFSSNASILCWSAFRNVQLSTVSDTMIVFTQTHKPV